MIKYELIYWVTDIEGTEMSREEYDTKEEALLEQSKLPTWVNQSQIIETEDYIGNEADMFCANWHKQNN